MSNTPLSDSTSAYFNKRIKIEADIDASGAKQGAKDMSDAAKSIKQSQDKIKGTTKITTEFETKGLEKTEQNITRMLNKIDTTLGGVGKNIGNSLGHNLEKTFNSPTVTKAIKGIGDRLKTKIAESMIAGTAQARGELAQNIKALQKSVVTPINDMIDFKSVKSELNSIINSPEIKRFTEIMEMMSGDRLSDNLKNSLTFLRGLSLRDKRLLGLLNQDSYMLSDKGSKQVATDLGRQESARTKMLKPLYNAQTKEAEANAKYLKNRDEREQRAEQRQLRKDAEQRQKAEQQRAIRQQLYKENVATAVANARGALFSTDDYEQKRLTDNYNRAVARIRGIYQSAVVHGRVENPETIQAGINELQQRSLALNNYRLEAQLGIKDINDELKTTVRRIEDMGTRWNKISSVLQNSVQAFAAIQSYAYRITSTLTNLARNALFRITSQVRSLVNESTAAFKSLEVSMIGFRNFFGEESTDRLYQRIKSIAARAPGLATTDLADYVRQIAPVSGHNADLALNASLGMLKTIQYGGASGSSEMEYVIKNIRDVLAKGKATAIDIRQFNRAMPILEEVLESVGQSQLLKDGVLTINKDNVDTILTAFAALNTSNQSAVKDIFSQMNQTLSGQWEQFREQFTTNLMEALRGSQVYGGAQNLLSQLNEGEYINIGLRRLQEALTNFISNINWFKLQRIAGEIWDGLKIIWEGLEDAFENIKKAIGGTQSKSAIKSFAGWIADIIRGMSEGVAQVIRFVKELEKTGIMNILSKFIGWFGSIGARLIQFMGTMASHLTNIAGNLTQVIGRWRKLFLTNKLNDLNARLEAIPVQARSQLISSSDLMNGTGLAGSSEASAINNLTNVVNTHLMKIEANQTGTSSTLGRVETAFNNGRQYVWTDDFDGAGHGALGTWDKKTQSYNWSGYTDNATGYTRYQQLITQNRLQASNNAFLQRVGNNRMVDSTLKWMKSAGQKILAVAQKLVVNVVQGLTTLMLTETFSTLINSLNLFGDATVYVAGVVKAAGYALTGALVGRTFGTAGGIVGALAGLAVGINELVKSVKKKADELTNAKVQKALDEEKQGIRDTIVDALIKNGALEASLGKRSNEENYALQQLSKIIANSSLKELEALGGRGLADVYGDALRYKTIQENFTNKNEGMGYDWSQHVGGRVVTKNDKQYLQMIYDMVNKYDLLASHGYEQGLVEGQRVYVDSNGNAISAETIWDEFFATQEGLDTVTAQQIEDMQTYLQTQEQSLTKEWDAVEAKLDKISDTPGKTWYDLIDSRLREANNHLMAIQAKNPTKESMSAIYGSSAGESFEKYNGLTNGIGNMATVGSQTDLRNFNRYFAGENVSPAEQARIQNLMDGEVYTENPKLNALIAWAKSNGLERDALTYDLTKDEVDRLYELLSGSWADKVGVDKVLNKLSADINASNDPAKRQAMFDALADISGFRMTDTNLLWWLRLLLKQEKMIGDYRFFAHGGLLTPVYRGVDTVPAMLSPGEFVMKPSAVKKAGLGMMYALNRGDLGAAARSLAGSVNNNWYRNNNASINNSRSTRTNINNFKIINKNASARLNSYYSLANRLSF
jgi:hypothetical protein